MGISHLCVVDAVVAHNVGGQRYVYEMTSHHPREGNALGISASDRLGEAARWGIALTPGEAELATLTYLLPSAWRYRPDHSRVPYEIWREMFLAARFTKDFAIAKRPRHSVVAFRGATAELRQGIGWTLDIDQARYFSHSRHAPGASVWVCTIPADRMLARYVSESFENEVTADVRGLRISEFAFTPAMRLLIVQRRLRASLSDGSVGRLKIR